MRKTQETSLQQTNSSKSKQAAAGSITRQTGRIDEQQNAAKADEVGGSQGGISAISAIAATSNAPATRSAAPANSATSGADKNNKQDIAGQINNICNRASTDLKYNKEKEAHQKSAAKNDDQLGVQAAAEAVDGPGEFQVESARKRKSPRIATKQPKMNPSGYRVPGTAGDGLNTEQVAQIKSAAMQYSAQEGGVEPADWTQ